MSYKLMNKSDLDIYLKELTKIIRKNNRKNNVSYELILVGGASILVNYDFRNSTSDIDVIDVDNILMNDAIDIVAKKYSLPSDWINTDFKLTKSYSDKLIQYSSFYKSFGNGTLKIRTIKDEYLIAMKLVSGRKYKNDLSDIIGIVNEIRKKRIIGIEEIDRAIIELYGTFDLIKKEAYDLLLKCLKDKEFDYFSINEIEKINRDRILENDEDIRFLTEDNIEYILNKIKND
ncbi:MAG: hypothetical protein E7180_01440 [Erysipelotrichaceae bacterium]|nr:hypothetical protein [Erysipelotrichaceae bacterium]